MRDYFVRRCPFQVSRGAQVACGIADAQNDQICSAFLSRLENLLARVPVLHDRFWKAPELCVCWNELVELAHRIGY
jgi:hypothetical protein